MKETLLKFLLLAVLAMAGLPGCAQYAAVSERPPRFRLEETAAPRLSGAVNEIRDALREQRRDPIPALGLLVSAAREAAGKLETDPSDPVAREAYDFAVARIVRLIGRAGLEPWKQPIQLPGSGGEVLVTRPDPRPAWNPALYRFVPADEFQVRGKFVRERSTRDGIGAPVVAIGRDTNQDYRATFSLPRTFYGVTAVVRFRGRTAELAFEDPLATEAIRLGRREIPLAADFTVPLAVLLAQSNPRRYELPRLLNPGRFQETARICRLQPYDPEKTVVLVVHGLMDTPATWTPLINSLRAERRIRENYQFWFFSYPSGLPYPYSAAILRRELEAAGRIFPLKKPMVVIGHSMGGCIARLLVTDSGETLWREIFRKPPGESGLAPDVRALMEESLIFASVPDVGRVIFISAPLRGSELASGFIGRLGSRFVRLPSHLLQAGGSALDLIQFEIDDLRVRGLPTSIDTLAPNNRFVRAINTIPMNPRVPLHVISGDRGRGGNKDRTRPVMTDGIVPYWSSHIPQARSELVVPSDHSAHQNREAIREVARILTQYAE